MSSAELTLFQRLARLSSAAEEAQAFMRRRREGTEPFSRVRTVDGRTVGHPPGSDRSRALFLAAADLVDAAPGQNPRPDRAAPRKQRGNPAS